MGRIYLDNAATTRVLPEVAEVMHQVLVESFGNPSSLHRMGIQAEKWMEESRQVVARTLNCRTEEVYFTSGGTEGNNLLIKGAVAAQRRRGRHVITTTVEHPAVLDTCRALKEDGGIELELVPVDQDGVVRIPELKRRLRDDTVLVSVMMVNNETGSIQPLGEISRLVHERCPGCLLHVDAIQGAGKMDLDVRRLQLDMVTVSAHKLHGPKGVGAVFVRSGFRIPPQIHGGGQERGLRSGTENVPGIVGFGAAVQHMLQHRQEAYERVKDLRRFIWEEVSRQVPDAVLNGSLDRTSPYILNVGFPGLRGEVLVHYLEAEDIYVSTGSACSSRRRVVSHVLEAMGVPEAVADGSIRISLSPFTTGEEIERFIGVLIHSVHELSRLVRR